MLHTNLGIDVSGAMKLAGYSKREIAKRSIRKSIVKKKNRLIQQNVEVKKSVPTVITASNTNTKANVSDVTDTTMSNGSKRSHTAMLDSNKSRVASARKSIKPRKKAFAKVIISKNSQCTPSQVKAADAERNASISVLQSAYKWAVSKASEYKNKVKLAEVASDKFNVAIVPQTLQKLLREGRDQILPLGPKPRMNQEEFDTIIAAVCSYVAIGQLNGEPAKEEK